MDNIILLTIDALRYDALGINCNHAGLTPNLDNSAKNNIKFDLTFSYGPYTRYSFPALFTSRYASQTTEEKGEKIGPGLSAEARIWVQVLKHHGYQTAGFLTNPYLTSFFWL